MSSSRRSKKYARDVYGIRDALFDELEDLRSGASSPHEAAGFCALAERVLDTFDMEMKREAFNITCDERKLRLQSNKTALLEDRTTIIDNEIDADEDDMPILSGAH